MSRTLFVFVTFASLALVRPVIASTSEQRCQRSLSSAAGKYLSCMQAAIGSQPYGLAGAAAPDSFRSSAGKCASSYARGWSKLVARYGGQGTSCEGTRYVDKGDGTFYDRLTHLTWEMKDDRGGIHDRGNRYSWSAAPFPTLETGTVFTSFLKTLNDNAFGSSSGWRLPSILELYALIEPAFPNCTTPPCTTAPGGTGPISFLSPACNCTVASWYWSSSTSPYVPDSAWGVHFDAGTWSNGILKTDEGYARAVRGGP